MDPLSAALPKNFLRIFVATLPPGPDTSVWSHSPGDGTWLPMTPLPEARTHHGCARLEDTYIVAGGWKPRLPWQTGGSHAMSSSHKLNLKTGVWSSIGPMSTGRALFSLINMNDKLVNH